MVLDSNLSFRCVEAILTRSTPNLKRKKRKTNRQRTLKRSKTLSRISLPRHTILPIPGEQPKIATKEEFARLLTINCLSSSSLQVKSSSHSDYKNNINLDKYIYHMKPIDPNIRYQIYPIDYTRRRHQRVPPPYYELASGCKLRRGFQNESQNVSSIDSDMFDGFVDYNSLPAYNSSREIMNHEEFSRSKRRKGPKNFYARNVIVAPIGNISNSFPRQNSTYISTTRTEEIHQPESSTSSQELNSVSSTNSGPGPTIIAMPCTKHEHVPSSSPKSNRRNIYLPNISKRYQCKEPKDCCSSYVTDCCKDNYTSAERNKIECHATKVSHHQNDDPIIVEEPLSRSVSQDEQFIKNIEYQAEETQHTPITHSKEILAHERHSEKQEPIAEIKEEPLQSALSRTSHVTFVAPPKQGKEKKLSIKHLPPVFVKPVEPHEPKETFKSCNCPPVNDRPKFEDRSSSYHGHGTSASPPTPQYSEPSSHLSHHNHHNHHKRNKIRSRSRSRDRAHKIKGPPNEGEQRMAKCNLNTCQGVAGAISVTYSTAIISTFPTFTVYEILKSTRRKPPNICKVTEQVFVTKHKGKHY